MNQAIALLHSADPTHLYQRLFSAEHVKFQYPPSALLLVDALRFVGIDTPESENRLNIIVLIGGGVSFALLAKKLIGERIIWGVAVPVAPAAYIANLASWPVLLAYKIGQIQLLLDGAFTLSCLMLLADRALLAGLFIGFTATIKPQVLPLLVLAAYRRRWRFVSGFVVGCVPLVVLSIYFYGWKNHIEYLDVLRYLSQHGEVMRWNQSINGIVNRLLYVGPSLDMDSSSQFPQSAFPPYNRVVYVATIVSGLFATALPFLLPSHPTGKQWDLREFGAAAVLFTMASPIAWVHHYGIVLPVYVAAIAVILNMATDRTKRMTAYSMGAVLVVSLLLVMVPEQAPVGSTRLGFDLVQLRYFIGVCLLVGLLVFDAIACSRQRRLSSSTRMVDLATR